MAALTRAAKIDWAPRAGRNAFPVVNGDTVYPNSFVGIYTDGMVRPWADTAGLVFFGLALDGQTTSKEVTGDGTDTPANRMRVNTEGLILRDVTVTGASAVTDVPDKVYCSTDNPLDLTLSATTNVKAIGEVLKWKSGTTCDVQIYTPREYRLQVLLGATITALTDSTTGTASDTLNDTTASVKDDLASLAAKVNELVAAVNGQLA